MARTASTVFAITAVAGIGATAVVSAAKRKTRRPAALTPPPLPAAAVPYRSVDEPTESGFDRVTRILISAMIVLSLASTGLLLMLSTVARAAPASNEEIRSHYGIDVVDNPDFSGATFLKRGDDHVAYVCSRPSAGDVMNSKDLSCHVA